MIERNFIIQKTKEFYIKKHITDTLKNVGLSQIRLKKIPLGEKVIISASRPSLIVGSKGSNIRALTRTLKKDFGLENPQIEINEIKDRFLDANVVAQRIASSLERFGSKRFKGVGHKVMQDILGAGALGVEVIISGKIPGARAKNWRFYQGYLKKCGDVAFSGVRKAQTTALLKSGIIGIKVAIMPPDIVLPDSIEILDEPIQIVEEVDVPKKKKRKSTKRKTTRKKAKKEEKKEEVAAPEPVVEVTEESQSNEESASEPQKPEAVEEKTEESGAETEQEASEVEAAVEDSAEPSEETQ